MNTNFERRRAKGLGWGYAKIISERVARKHKMHCSESMVYHCLKRKNNPYILLEIEIYKAEIREIEAKIDSLQEANS